MSFGALFGTVLTQMFLASGTQAIALVSMGDLGFPRTAAGNPKKQKVSGAEKSSVFRTKGQAKP